jgi:hypothetical protein
MRAIHDATGGRGGARSAPFSFLAVGCGSAEAVVDGGAKALVGHGRDGDPCFRGLVGLMEQVEQAGGGFD